jgi:hypothetical protein
MTIFRDAVTSTAAHVDENNDLHVFAITESEIEAANTRGNAFNINTGLIALTGTSDSAVFYFKNDEPTDYVINGLVVFLGQRSATVTDYALCTVIKDPTGGDILTGPTDVDINSNSNFGSSKKLSSTTFAYKGADGDTMTGGTTHAIIGIAEGRNQFPIPMELPRGSAMGVKIDLNTSGGANVYVALIGYLKDENDS